MVAPECGDIGGLADRVGQKARWNAGLKIPLLNFGLDGGVALQPGHGDQIQVEEGQLRQLRHLRLNKQVGFRRIQPAGEVIQGHLQNVFPDFVGMVGIVGEGLRVGDHDVDPVKFAGILQLHPAAQRADIVAQMQPPGGAVASQNDFFHVLCLLDRIEKAPPYKG